MLPRQVETAMLPRQVGIAKLPRQVGTHRATQAGGQQSRARLQEARRLARRLFGMDESPAVRKAAANVAESAAAVRAAGARAAAAAARVEVRERTGLT